MRVPGAGANEAARDLRQAASRRGVWGGMRRAATVLAVVGRLSVSAAAARLALVPAVSSPPMGGPTLPLFTHRRGGHSRWQRPASAVLAGGSRRRTRTQTSTRRAGCTGTGRVGLARGPTASTWPILHPLPCVCALEGVLRKCVAVVCGMRQVDFPPRLHQRKKRGLSTETRAARRS